jgi:uncharacterized protein with von Willebrand factor type A (vWA) domain
VPADVRNADARVARNLLGFTRLLREAGVPVDATRARLALSALAELGLEREPDVRAACRSVLVSRHTDIAAFEAVFDRFWALLRGGAMPPGRTTTRLPKGPLDISVPLIPPSAISGASVIEHSIHVVASPAEVLRGTDFAAMTAAERAAAARFLDRLRWSPGLRPSRRYRPARHGDRLDARGTMRRSLRTGGEPVALVWRARREKRRPLVILCDISGSMEAYTRLLLHLSHGLTRGWGRVEVFTFGTRLTRVTRQLRERRPDAAISRVSRIVADWSGGTRIGEAVGEFNRRWSRRVLGRGAIVLFLSDGWERGDPDRLAAEMARLQRGAYRLIWLNPLSGTRDYAPAAAGAQAIVRFVDDHLASNTLDGLLHVGALLERVGRGRPTRRAELRVTG